MFHYARSNQFKMKFGAHVNIKGGVSNCILNSMDIGGNAIALFLKSPRKWVSPMMADSEVVQFKKYCEEYKVDPSKDILPHGSYLLNLANPDEEKETKAFDALIDDLTRCEKLGIHLYNLHPGSSVGSDRKEGLARLAKNVNRAIAQTQFVKIVLENMAGQGNVIGCDLKDLAEVIGMVEDKSRVRVCIDTCHTFAAGYDLRDEVSYEKFWKEFSDVIGYEYLGGIHLNDSEAPLGANRDLHQKLGLGFLGLETFRLVANDKRLEGLPIILETPTDKDDVERGDEIKLLEWMIGKDKNDAEFLEKSKVLSGKGEKERKEQLEKYEKKKDAEEKKASKKRANGGAGSGKRIKRDISEMVVS